MARLMYALISGLLFGSGLVVSGMADTTKVQGWLDVFGNWDPTLAFVIGGAILPMAIAWAWSNGRKPRLGGSFPAKPDPKLDRGLIVGSVLFGMGWALAGFCPGPSLASLSFGGWQSFVFLGAMILGMWLAPRLKSRLDTTEAAV